MIRQPFHLVEYSPWPLTASFGALLLTSGLALWFHNIDSLTLIMGVMLIISTMLLWWRDVIRESLIQGYHTSLVIKGLKTGMILFITSEVLFFFAFFWAFFQSSLSPCIELGNTWPPTNLNPLNPFAIPLLNTTVLLSSGISVTWAHHSLLAKNNKEMMTSLFITLSLGVYFSYLQMGEYIDSTFTISDNVYGATFFVATGFHGLHVIIGSTFLFIMLMRSFYMQFSSDHHLGFEAAAWYWHFVDVVWIFLYISIYWWGS